MRVVTLIRDQNRVAMTRMNFMKRVEHFLSEGNRGWAKEQAISADKNITLTDRFNQN